MKTKAGNVMKPMIKAAIFLFLFAATSNLYAQEQVRESLSVPGTGLAVLYPKGNRVGGQPRKIPDAETGSIATAEFYIEYKNVWLQEIFFHSERSVSGFSKKRGNFISTRRKLLDPWFSTLDYLRLKKEFPESKEFKASGSHRYKGECYKAEPYDFYLHDNITFVGDTMVTVSIGSRKACEEIIDEVEALLGGIRFIK